MRERVARLHFAKAMCGFRIETFAQVLVQQRDKSIPEKLAPGHPLVVVPPPVIVGTIQFSSRKAVHDPVEEGFVIRVHPKGNVRLSAVAPEVPFTDEDSQQEADVELSRRVGLFHRHVSRETWLASSSCFTVMFPVKHSDDARARFRTSSMRFWRSAGETPDTLEACARVVGRIRLNFSRASWEIVSSSAYSMSSGMPKFARARNAGVRAAAHDILVFLDGDVIPEAGLVAAHARWHHVVSDALTLGFCAYVPVAGIGAGRSARAKARSGNCSPGGPSTRPGSSATWRARATSRRGTMTSSAP